MKAYINKLISWLQTRYLILAIILLGLIGVVYSAPKLVSYKSLEPAHVYVQSVDSKPAIKSLSKSQPTTLIIPKIGVNTSIINLGLKSDGTMHTPAGAEEVGWYKYSPTPGEIGPAVIVGHVDSPKGPAIFWRLRELQPGDTFTVSRHDGTTANFKVDVVKVVSQSDFPTEEVYGNIDHAGIRLITCSGIFDSNTHRYDQNLVVFASIY